LCSETERDWDKVLAEEVKAECQEKYGSVVHIKVERDSQVCSSCTCGDVYAERAPGRDLRAVRVDRRRQAGDQWPERPLVRRQADLRHVHPRRHHASSQVTGTTGVPVRKSKNGWLSTGVDDKYQYYRRAYSVCSSYLEVMYIFAKSTIVLHNYNDRGGTRRRTLGTSHVSVWR
jgi:hypothetical protein